MELCIVVCLFIRIFAEKQIFNLTKNIMAKKKAKKNQNNRQQAKMSAERYIR